MRLRSVVLLTALLLTACTPSSPRLMLPENCRADLTAQELVGRHWLQQPDIWRLRQAALLEIGPKKIPLEGFLRLDLNKQEARLLAMNEMGVVLFDLLVTVQGETMQRAIPQLQQMPGLAEGVALSLRQIFLQPRPDTQDQLEEHGNSQRLRRFLPGTKLGFTFDCDGVLRKTRLQGESGDWQVLYSQYRSFGETALPMEIILNNYRQKVKLSLWIKEGRQEE